MIKKIGTFGFYKAAESYGWDRLYRRLLKFNREERTIIVFALLGCFVGGPT